jgi:hypothetical protein
MGPSRGVFYQGIRKVMIVLAMFDTNVSTKDEPKMGNIKINSMIYPSDSSWCHCRAAFSGNSPSTTLNPSNGWIGMRLKIARKTFI